MCSPVKLTGITECESMREFEAAFGDNTAELFEVGGI